MFLELVLIPSLIGAGVTVLWKIAFDIVKRKALSIEHEQFKLDERCRYCSDRGFLVKENDKLTRYCHYHWSKRV